MMAPRPIRHVWSRAVSALVSVAVLLVLAFALPGAGAAFTAVNNGNGSLTSALSFYAASVLSDNPTGYWRLNEPVGTRVAVDAGALAHPGTYLNSPALGQSGMSQDGGTAQGSGRYGTGFLPRLVKDSFTLELWVKTRESSTTGTGEVNWATAPFGLLSGARNGLSLTMGIRMTGDGRIVVGTGSLVGGYLSVESPAGTAYNDGNWHLIDFVRDPVAKKMFLYVDGLEAKTGVGDDGAISVVPVLGLGDDFNGNTHTAQTTATFDEVAQYGIALTAVQVASHYAARIGTGYATTVRGDSPVGYWRLNGAGNNLVPTVGGSAALGGCGAAVTRAVAGATGDGDTAIATQTILPVDVSSRAYVPRLVAGNFSLEAWFRTTQTTGGSSTWVAATRIFGARVPDSSADFGIGITAAGQVLAGTSGGTVNVASSASGYNNGGWHQVVFTRSVAGSGTVTLYLDGVQAGTVTGSGTAALTAAATLGIGADVPTSSSIPTAALVGAIDDVSQFPTVLSADRVQAHYNARTSASGYDSAIGDDQPSGFWLLGDTTGTTLTAQIGGSPANGYTGSSVQRGLTGVTGGTALGFAHPEQAAANGVRVPRLVTDDFSLECWFLTTTTAAGANWYSGAPLIQGEIGGTKNDYGLSMSTDGRLQFGAVEKINLLTSPNSLNDGAWHHVVVTRKLSTGTVVLYVDGDQVASATGPKVSLNEANIGLGISGYGIFSFEGNLDEVAVYDHVLTPDRVRDHYHRGSGQ